MKQFILECTEFRRALKDWFLSQGRRLPWRETNDPYRILVSELMLQQTQVSTVLPYYRRWFDAFPTAADLAQADESKVLRAWEGLGYYNRARNLHRCAKIITLQRDGIFPSSIDDLMSLPGIGRYTAGAMRSFAFNLSAPIVDGNVARVLSRILNLQHPIDEPVGKSLIWEAAERYAAAEMPRILNSALMELGALICLPRKPSCALCPVRSFCRAVEPELLPRKKQRPQVEVKREFYFWAFRDGQVLLAQNRGKRWQGLWSLPKFDGAAVRRPEIILRHPITRFVIQLEVYRIGPPSSVEAGQEWHCFESLPQLPIPSPHRRAIRMMIENDVDKTGTGVAPDL